MQVVSETYKKCLSPDLALFLLLQNIQTYFSA